MFSQYLFSFLLASQAVVLTYAAPAAGSPGPIHPNGDTTKCLDVRGGDITNGTAVQIFDCNGSQAQIWDIALGNTAVTLHGTGFCLDAGDTPANGVQMKIWTCFEGLAAQEWVYTTDNRIALRDQGLCLDLTLGAHVNSNPVQTWQCTDNNFNQVWNLDI